MLFRSGEDDSDDDDDDDDDFDSTGRGRRIAFYLVIAVICVACIFAIYSMLRGDNRPPTQTTTIATTVQATSTPAATSESVAETTAAPSETTTGPTTQATTTVPGGNQTYTVQANDTMWSISMRFYGAANDDLFQLIRDANGMSGDTINVGQVLNIPPRP